MSKLISWHVYLAFSLKLRIPSLCPAIQQNVNPHRPRQRVRESIQAWPNDNNNNRQMVLVALQIVGM